VADRFLLMRRVQGIGTVEGGFSQHMALNRAQDIGGGKAGREIKTIKSEISST